MDSSLVKAHVSQREPPGASGQRHDRGGIQGTGHRDQADEVNGLFPITETTVDGYGIGHEATRYVQNSDGRFPPSPVDIDARWRTSRRGKRAGLNYRQNVIVDLDGFIAWVWLHRLDVASSSAGGRFTGGLPTHLRRMGSRPGSVGLPAGSSNRCRWRRTQPTAPGNSGRCRRNEASRPASPHRPRNQSDCVSATMPGGFIPVWVDRPSGRREKRNLPYRPCCAFLDRMDGWMDGCVTRPEKQALTQLLSGENKSFQTARIQHIFWAFLSRKTLP